MEIVTAGVGRGAGRTGKGFAALLRHRQRIHVRPEQERPAPLPAQLGGDTMPAGLRLQAIVSQLLHDIGLRIWHIQADLRMAVQPAAVGHRLLTQLQRPFIKVHSRASSFPAMGDVMKYKMAKL